MRIKFIGQTGKEVVIRDILSPQFRTWSPSEIKDVPDDLMIKVAGAEGAEDGNAVSAVLNCGPNFVDAVTGKNPLFTCASCGEPAMNDFFVPDPDKDPVYYANAAGDRLCVPCFLFAHPEAEFYHTHHGHTLPKAFVAKLRALRAGTTATVALAAAIAPAPAAIPFVPSAADAHDLSEDEEPK